METGMDTVTSASYMLSAGVSFKRQKSENEDNGQGDDVNKVKRQKQEHNEIVVNTFTTENNADNDDIIKEFEKDEETEDFPMKDNSENVTIAGTCATENSAGNEFTVKPENDTETEDIAQTESSENSIETEDIVQAESSENSIETEDIAQTESIETEDIAQTESSEKNVETEYITQTESSEKNVETEDIVQTESSEKNIETEDIAQTESSEKNIETEDIVQTESSEKNVETEDIVQKEGSEKDAETEDVTQRNSSEKDAETEDVTQRNSSEKDAETEVIAQINSPEHMYYVETEDVTQRNSSEKDAETEIIAQEDGSENLITIDKSQEPPGKDESTHVTEDDLVPSEEERYVSSLPQTSPDYRHGISDTWLEVPIKRSPETEPVGSPNEGIIYVYNTSRDVGGGTIWNKFSETRNGQELFYHGTTRDSAKSIIEQGIDVTKSDRPVDFSYGKGFYVTNNYGKAFQWSKRKERYGCSKPALIAFKIDSDSRSNETHLSLKLNNATNRKFWECIVSHFRHRETSPDVTRVLKDVKYIEGPVAKNRNLGGDEIPTPADHGSFLQLCICDQGYARKFGSLANIFCVMFVTD